MKYDDETHPPCPVCNATMLTDITLGRLIKAVRETFAHEVSAKAPIWRHGYDHAMHVLRQHLIRQDVLGNVER